jgi:hypothetical protein
MAQSVPKEGGARASNEDRMAASAARHGPLRVAIADGATSAYRAGEWGELLVKAWVRGDLRSGLSNTRVSDRLAMLAEQWWATEAPPSEAPWYVQEKAERGGFAALLGVELQRAGPTWKWQALAVGDCNLFLVRDCAMVESFPVRRSHAFGSIPPLVSSTRAIARSLRVRRTGFLSAGDSLFLASDALAAWMLRATEHGSSPWGAARQAARSGPAFASWIETLRRADLNDDDTTLIVVERGG